MKKIIFLIVLSFVFICSSTALTYKGCEYSVVSRMKSIVNNINLSYDYQIVNDEPNFSVTINNLTDDIYFCDINKSKCYYYNNTDNGEITILGYKFSSGTYKFYSNNNNCKDVYLGAKYYKFPEYNIYYGSELCSDIPNFSLCQKWGNVNYSYEEFEQKVIEYKDSKNKIEDNETKVEYEKSFLDRFIELYINYYYIFLAGIIMIGSTLIIVNNRKNRFKL